MEITDDVVKEILWLATCASELRHDQPINHLVSGGRQLLANLQFSGGTVKEDGKETKSDRKWAVEQVVRLHAGSEGQYAHEVIRVAETILAWVRDGE